MKDQSSDCAQSASVRTLIFWMLRLMLCGILCSAQFAYAAYVNRYSNIANGALTFTGNTIGLNKAASTNAPGASGAIEIGRAHV